MKKQLMIAGMVSTIGLAGLAGASLVAAEGATDTTSSPMRGLVSAIAKKFNLQESDVQQVFDDQHSHMEQERETEIKNEITQLVKEGKLTQAQADALNTKRSELQRERDANRSSDQSSSHKDMKTRMEAERTELETWAESNSIDTQYLRYVFGYGGRGHGGGDIGDYQDDTNTSDTNTNSAR